MIFKLSILSFNSFALFSKNLIFLFNCFLVSNMLCLFIFISTNASFISSYVSSILHSFLSTLLYYKYIIKHMLEYVNIIYIFFNFL
nr:MAG TPA: hypothetical protein [Caudoviricetes sp.]